ncbi:MAG: ankyrin repeat domain-containing protein, partial [Ottowia sp.]|nr:ankyrin repeat domain-containing protein [Ottowia sp.]
HARDKDGKTALMQLARRHIPASNPILEPEEVQEQIAQTNAAIKLLLDAGADVNARDNDGQTALMHTADLFGNIHAIQPLLEAGADVNARDSGGKTTLMRLMHRNFGSFEPDEGPSEITQTKAAIKLLLDAGADVNATDKDGWTALHWSFSTFGNLVVSPLLLEAGANVNAAANDGETVLMRLGSYGNELESNEKVIRIIAQYCFGIEASQESGVSYTAVQQELSAKLIKLLLDAGANIDASDKDGRTALHYATGSSLFPNTYAIKPLLEAGANINARDNEGRTPLLGFFCSDDKIKQLLIEAGADVNAADNKGRTALMGASAEATKLLLSAGANANAVAYDGRTALMGADAETAKLLINAGINIHATTSKGVNALMCAGSAESARLLMDAGINIHASDSEGETALMRNLRPEKTALLIEAGLDVNAASNNGCTALMLASGAEIDKFTNDDGSITLIPRGNAETVKILLDAGAHINAADNEGKTALLHNIGAIGIIAGEVIDETNPKRIEREKQRKAERIEHFRAITAVLLEAGANPNAADNEGKTALTLAQEHGLDDVAALLRAAGATD